MSVLRRRTSTAWRVLSGAARTPVAPGRPKFIAAVPSSGQVALQWAAPFTGGAAITSYTILRDDVVLTTVGGAVTSYTDSTVANGTSYVYKIRATNVAGTGSTSGGSGATTPVVVASAYPTVATTGVPIGLAGDGRAPEALTPVENITALNASHQLDLKTSLSGTTYDHADFLNVTVLFRTGVHDITFNKCHFRIDQQPDTVNKWSLMFQFQGAVSNIAFVDCTLNGNSIDPYWPVRSMLSFATASGGAIPSAVTNLTFTRCNVYGFNDLFNVGNNANGLTIEDSFLHHPVIDKSTDLSVGKTNPAVWGHSDATQIGGVGIHNFTVRRNYIDAVHINGDSGNAICQVGSLQSTTGGNVLENVLYEDNWFNGGSYMFNANLRNPITVIGYVSVRRNHFGLKQTTGVASPSFGTLCTEWADNVWDVSGVNKDGGGVPVVAGQPVTMTGPGV